MQTKNVRSDYMQITSMEATTYCLSMHIRTHKQDTDTQARELEDTGHSYSHHSSGTHIYGLGQRECDLQTLPLSRRRKMGENNRNRLRCFLHQLSPPHCMLPTLWHPKVTHKPQKVTQGHIWASISSCPARLYDAFLPWLISITIITGQYSPRTHWMDIRGQEGVSLNDKKRCACGPAMH